MVHLCGNRLSSEGAPTLFEEEVVEDEGLPDPPSLKLPGRRAFRPASMMAGSASMMLGLRVLHEDIKGMVGISLHASA